MSEVTIKPATTHNDEPPTDSEMQVMVREIHRILVGQPEYKRPGLVELVDRHEKLITRWGGSIAVIIAILEIYRAFSGK